MPPLLISQTLHGYDQGHRLLAAGGDVSSDELALLDRLSDLSGYLPSGARFERYHTGFPCGRYYAFACTWPDEAASRAGTVLTHTLLVPSAALSELDSLGELARLHHKPASAAERAAYQKPLEVRELSLRHALVPLAGEEATAAVMLFFGQSERPILWVDEQPPEEVVHFLWGLLWPEARAQFAFCTFALQSRAVGGRPFDVLGIPPPAQGAFLERAASAAWYWAGRSPRTKVQASLQEQPWVAALAKGGAAEVRRLVEWCRARGLPLPTPSQFPMLWRMEGFEDAATERLAAARARHDLLERLWPELPPSHPYMQRSLRELLARQVDAPLTPRPLWELRDLFSRTALRNGAVPPAGEVLTRELARRLAEAPSQTVAELPGLLEVAVPAWESALLDGLLLWLERAPVSLLPDATLGELLVVSVERGWPRLAEAVRAKLPPASRRRAVEEATRNRALNLQLWRALARSLEDPALLVSMARRDGSALEGLRAATALLAETRGVSPERMGPLVAELEPWDVLAWALELDDPRMASWAARQGAQAARSMKLDPSGLGSRCERAPNGPRVFADFVDALPREERAAALRAYPELVLRLLRLSLSDEDSRLSSAASLGFDRLSDEVVLHPAILSMLTDPATASRMHRYCFRIGPAWIHAVCAGWVLPTPAAEWLDSAELRLWIRYAGRYQLRDAVNGAQDSGLPRMTTAIRESLSRHPTLDLYSFRILLEVLLECANREALETAIDDLVTILRLMLSARDHALVAPSLNAVVTRSPSSGYRVVELTFPTAYESLLGGDKSALSRVLVWAFGGDGDWDRAKPWRDWLLDTFVQNGWPPDSFLRSLGGNKELFYHLMSRAEGSPEGRIFVRKLPATLEADPELARLWRGPLEDSLSRHPG
jgi:hypothetical protein